MKFKEKLKNFQKVALLSAGILSAFAGCATTTPWQTVRTKYEPTGIEREVILDTTPKKTEEIEFKISEPYFEKDYHVQIKESKNEINSEIAIIGKEKEFEKVLIEARKVRRPFDWSSAPNEPLWGVLGLSGGVLLGAYLNEDLYAYKDESDEYDPTFAISLGLVGLCGGVYLGYKIEESLRTTEIRRTGTNETIEQLLPSRKNEETDLGTLSIYQDKSASGIIVKLAGEGREKMYATDSEGVLNLSNFLDSLNPNYFFRNYSDEETEDRIGNIPLVQQIKPRALETLMDDLVEAISAKEINLTVNTEEESLNGVKIINDSRTFNINGGQITDEAIYGIVEQFVDEEINSHVKSLTFVVKDDISHIPIKHSNFDFKLNAPRKEDLVGEYFTQNLKDYAEECVVDYLEGDTIIENCPERVLFKIYAPSRVQIEVTNPNYNFVSGMIDVKDQNLEKKVYMIDKGSKIRVQDAGDERGRIE